MNTYMFLFNHPLVCSKNAFSNCAYFFLVTINLSSYPLNWVTIPFQTHHIEKWASLSRLLAPRNSSRSTALFLVPNISSKTRNHLRKIHLPVAITTCTKPCWKRLQNRLSRVIPTILPLHWYPNCSAHWSTDDNPPNSHCIVFRVSKANFHCSFSSTYQNRTGSCHVRCQQDVGIPKNDQKCPPYGPGVKFVHFTFCLGKRSYSAQQCAVVEPHNAWKVQSLKGSSKNGMIGNLSLVTACAQDCVLSLSTVHHVLVAVDGVERTRCWAPTKVVASDECLFESAVEFVPSDVESNDGWLGAW